MFPRPAILLWRFLHNFTSSAQEVAPEAAEAPAAPAEAPAAAAEVSAEAEPKTTATEPVHETKFEEEVEQLFLKNKEFKRNQFSR